MFNFFYHIFCETGLPVWGVLALGVIAVLLEYWEDLTNERRTDDNRI